MILFKRFFGSRSNTTSPAGSPRSKPIGGSKRPAPAGTDLIDAAMHGNSAKLHMLLDQGADVNAKASDGRTALITGSLFGHVDVVQTLLDRGADVNAKDHEGWTALMMAARTPRRDVMQALLAKGAVQDLFVAAILGDVVLVRTLLDQGADVNARTNNGETALFLASQKSHQQVVQELLAKGAQQDLFIAAILGDMALLRAMLDQGADVNAKTNDGETALILACKQGRLEEVRTLLERAEINAKDKYGETALMKASRAGHLEIVQALLEKGVEVNAEDKYGKNALYAAVGKDRVEVVQALLDRGAVDKEGAALKIASYFCYGKVEQALLGKFAPKLAGTTNPEIQAEFDQLWVAATMIQKNNIMRGGHDEGDTFIKRYIYERLAEKCKLEPEDFGKLEMNFRRNWHPSFSKGWERN